MLVAIIFLLLYSLFLIFLWFRREPRKPVLTSASQPSHQISVIIPFRNEIQRLSRLVDNLLLQQGIKAEFIFVDDHSNDGTHEWLMTCHHPAVKVLKSNGHGKKQAVLTGIEKASGTWIVTTDADCEVGPYWLQSIQQSVNQGILALPIRLPNEPGLWSAIQRIEFSSIMGLAISLANLGKPVMISAAGMAYQKELFLELDPYRDNLHQASGDDEYLLKAAIKKGKPVEFCTMPEAIVTTVASPNVVEFLHQRLRWAGKWRSGNSITGLILAPLIILIHWSWLFLLASVLRRPELWAVSTLAIKVLAEGMFLFKSCNRLKMTWSTPAFLILQVVYPFYVLFVGVGSLFLKPEWKGRKIK